MAAARQAAKPAWRIALQKWAYNRSYFPQIGMMRDDTLMETDVIKEAIRRLPADVYDERIFRMTRAIHLSGKKNILPKEEWMTLDKDVHYLKPYIEQVTKEVEEKQEWAKK